jgi:hypothetical protein
MSQARDTRTSGTGPNVRIGYARVSTVSHTLDQQEAAYGDGDGFEGRVWFNGCL